MTKAVDLEVGGRALVQTDEPHKVVLNLKFVVSLPIDPEAASSHDDRLILTGFSDQTREQVYRQEKTTRDDVVKGDRFTTVVFENLKPGLYYDLLVDFGDGDHYYHLRGVPFSRLFRLRVERESRRVGALRVRGIAADEAAGGS